MQDVNSSMLKYRQGQFRMDVTQLVETPKTKNYHVNMPVTSKININIDNTPSTAKYEHERQETFGNST